MTERKNTMMQSGLQVEEGRRKRHFQVSLATSKSEIREAQRLRWQVFAEEMGARLTTTEPGLDIDLYDAWCEHLIVRDLSNGEIIGTYRILNPASAKKLGSFYSDQEFDLTRLGQLRERMVEIGRSCVQSDYRSGGAITMLWSGLASYMKERGYDYLMGCASIAMRDGGHNAAGVWHAIRDKHLAPAEWRVFPRCPLPLDALTTEAAPIIPPLIKGYLRAGAYICGEPAWDPDFNTADILILLPMHKVSPAYARHFLHNQAD
jgi:putative hemolysin